MMFYRYIPFERTVQASVTVSEGIRNEAMVEVFVNAPLIGRVIVRWDMPAPQWLRGKIRAQVCAAVFAPSYWSPIWSAVTRCGFLDREVGDVPIAWEWYSDGRKIDRAAERAERAAHRDADDTDRAGAS